MKAISVKDAVGMVPDGASLMIGGFMGVGTPERLVDELVRQGKRKLAVIANDTALPGRGIGKLVSAGLVARAVASHDVASGHLAALRHGKIGERYILGGQNVRLSQMLADIAGFVGGRPPRIRLPWQAVVPVAFAAEAVAHLTGREPFVTLTGVLLAKSCMFFTSAKAEQALGYRSRSYVQGLEDAVRWFHDHGYLGPRVQV